MSAGTNTADQVFMKSATEKVAQTLPFISLHLSNPVLFYWKFQLPFISLGLFPPIFHFHCSSFTSISRYKESNMHRLNLQCFPENRGSRVLPRNLNVGQFLNTALIIEECFTVQITKWSAGWSIQITKILLNIKSSFTFYSDVLMVVKFPIRTSKKWVMVVMMIMIMLMTTMMMLEGAEFQLHSENQTTDHFKQVLTMLFY